MFESDAESTPALDVRDQPPVALHLSVLSEALFHPDLIQARRRRPGSRPLGYSPLIDIGPFNYKEGTTLVGVGYAENMTGGLRSEDFLLIRTNPETVMDAQTRTNLATARSTATAERRSSGFTSRTDFLSNAWEALNPGGGAAVYQVRSCARRYSVTNVSSLAGALSETSPYSYWLDKIVGENGQSQARTGWVYVEFVSNANGVYERIVHQFTPSDLIMVSDTVDVSFEDPDEDDLDLVEMVNDRVQTGWIYAASRCLTIQVEDEGDLVSTIPDAPAAISSGVTAL